jgi:hypothetical protein
MNRNEFEMQFNRDAIQENNAELYNVQNALVQKYVNNENVR